MSRNEKTDGKQQSLLLSAASCLLPAVCCLLSACHREARELSPPISVASRSSVTSNHSYEGNAYAISKGQQWFEQYNCSGCHAHGGGGIGPALMDEQWIYGNSPEQIHDSIALGRPNGMPSYGERLTTEQVWQLVSYVRSLSGLEPPATVSPRGDEMQARRTGR